MKDQKTKHFILNKLVQPINQVKKELLNKDQNQYQEDGVIQKEHLKVYKLYNLMRIDFIN